MILGKDINPKKQIYYVSAQILNELTHMDNNEFDYFIVYRSLKSKVDISFSLYLLALDWLFLLGAIKKDKNRLTKCF